MRELREVDTTRFQNLANQIKKAANDLRKANASLQAQLGGAQDDQRKFRGRLEELEHLTGRLSAQVSTMGKFLDQRFGLSVVTLPPDLPSDPEPLFAYGEQVLAAGQYDLARAVFRHFLTSHSGDAKEDLAHVRVAQAYRGQKRYKQALRSYSEVYKKYSSVGRRAKPDIIDVVLWESAETLKLWGQCEKSRKMYRHLSEFKHLKRAQSAKSRAKSMRCR
jgi:TolA-binding protein